MSYTIHRCVEVDFVRERSPIGSNSPLVGAASVPLLMALVTKTWSPQTTGELQPSPGMLAFQTTFSVSLHTSGSDGSSSPIPACVPRNCGHWSVAAAAVNMRMQRLAVTIARRFIVVSLGSDLDSCTTMQESRSDPTLYTGACPERAKRVEGLILPQR